jgi:CubicO group peptidase (beta-lactamase class C family)
MSLHQTRLVVMPQSQLRGHGWRECVRTIGAHFLLCLLMTHFLSAADSSQTKTIEAILGSAGVKTGSLPGAAVLVAKNGQLLFARGYGVTDLYSHHEINTHTNFRLASVTKQFTAMAIMLLVHDGKLRYDERLTDIFPNFPEYGRAISVRNLLNHTSGLQDYEDLMSQPDPNLSTEQNQINDDGVLKLLERQMSAKFVPGSKWEYSNSGYVVLGLVKKISGQSLPDFLHERIFGPLNMTGTIAHVNGKDEVANRAFGHTFDNGKWKQTDQSPTSATLGDGGIYSSIEDMAKWDHALRQNTLLTAREMEPALTPVIVENGAVTGPDGTPAAYGFGWFLNPYKGHRRMWHYGETIGFRTTIQRFTNEEITIVILCNRADLNPTKLALQIADLYLHN